MSRLTRDLYTMMAHYLQKQYRDASREARVEAVKLILYRLWVKQQTPHFLFADDPFHVQLDSAVTSTFSWPIKSLFLWEYSALESPLV